MTNTLEQQYQLIKSARLELLDYCKIISNENFLMELSSFNNSSIHHLLVHIANVYRFWLAENAMKEAVPSYEKESFTNIQRIYALFEQVNQIMDKFLEHFKDRMDEPLNISITRLEKTIKASPMTIFTHVITHEFHHKGQILSMSRQLGYVPVDTDVIRF